ncbi:MAG: phosphatidate cytidylyltransferase [Marinifilaceae bacterium]
MNNFVKRIISGFLFVVLLTACIYISPWTYFVLFFVLNIVALYEFAEMVRVLNIKVNKPMFVICGSALFTAGFLAVQYGYIKGYWWFAALTFVLSIWELYRKKQHAFQNLAFAYYGLVYISLTFVMLTYLPYVSTGSWNPGIIFYPFILVWINDTFAYLSGSQFGKHKLFPRISPKKSWEGAIGGGVCTIVAGVFIAPFLTGFDRVEGFILSLIVVVFGIFGDLIESMFKRSIEIKDSGKIIPGHGGLLDRIDSVIFAIPAIFIYMVLVY